MMTSMAIAVCRRAAVLVVFLATCVSSAPAATLQGVTLPDTAKVGDETVTLNGMGVRVALVFVKVYVAGLYLEHPTRDASAATRSDEAKRIVLQFLREVSHQEMVKAMKDGFARTETPALEPEIERFCGVFTEPLTEGVQVVIDYVPGTGTTTTIGGQVKDTIPGAAFMRAVWGVWLGKDPPDADLKEELLGEG